jgi:hypothetical protein
MVSFKNLFAGTVKQAVLTKLDDFIDNLGKNIDPNEVKKKLISEIRSQAASYNLSETTIKPLIDLIENLDLNNITNTDQLKDLIKQTITNMGTTGGKSKRRRSKKRKSKKRKSKRRKY